MFHVIEFSSINEIAVAPSNWIKEGKCVWPPVKTPSKLTKMEKNRMMPGENWQEYAIRTIGEFATYEEARKKLKKAEDTSDLQTDVEKSRKRGKKRCFSESESSDEDSQSLLPQAPPIPKKNTLLKTYNTTSYIPTLLSNSAPSTSDFNNKAIHSHTPTHSYSAPSTSNHSHTPTHSYSAPSTSDFNIHSHTPAHLYSAHTPTHLNSAHSTSNHSHTPAHLYSAHTPTHLNSAHSTSNHSHTPTLFRQQSLISEPHSYSASNFHNTHNNSLNTQYLEQPSPSHLNTTQFQQSCSCNKLTIEILKSIQKELTAHTLILKDHSLALTKILSNHQIPSAETSQSIINSLPVSLPLTSIEGLRMLEDFLEDESNFKQLVSYLASFGGEGTKKILQRLLPNIISHDLSMKINWKGRNNKHKFEQYSRIQGVIYHAVKLNSQETVTLAVIENSLKDWFRFSADRNGGRNKRRNMEK